jgi:zinc transport system substrate-binding protein
MAKGDLTWTRNLAAALWMSWGGMVAHAKDVSAYRAFVADRASGTVHVVDLEAQKLLAPLSLPATAILAQSSSARMVYAASAEAQAVLAIDTGIAFVSHGDHMDLIVGDPKVLPQKIDGPKPSHVVSHRGRVAMFFDGDGTARLLSDSDILKAVGAPKVFGDGPAHHGVAVPGRGWIAVSTPKKSGEEWSANGVTIYDDDGAKRAVSPECSALHGEAASSRAVVFGCEDGVLVVSSTGVADKTPYPDATGEGERMYTIDPAPGFSMFVGDFGPNALIAFSPEDRTFHKIELPEKRVAFAVDPSDGGRVVVVLSDGSVRVFNTITGAELFRRDGVVTPAADLPDGARERSRLAIAGPHILVTDPAKGRAVQLRANDLSVAAAYGLGGKPMFAVAVGGSGTAH